MAPGLLDSELLGLQTMEHMMRVSRTWDSLISLLPKGGEAIWGDLDSSPEDGHECDLDTKGYFQTDSRENGSTNKATRPQIQMNHQTNYGRIIAFGKAASEHHSSKIPTISPQVHAFPARRSRILTFESWFSQSCMNLFDLQELIQTNKVANLSAKCGNVWTEYGKISRKSIHRLADNKAYTAGNLMDLLRFVAPKTMQRAEAHFSHGIAEDLDDPKYDHYKYWSNPLETKYVNSYSSESFDIF